jgi:hypothetical protein
MAVSISRKMLLNDFLEATAGQGVSVNLIGTGASGTLVQVVDPRYPRPYQVVIADLNGQNPVPKVYNIFATMTTTGGSQQPKAGADFLITIPPGVLWVILGFADSFVASATVANRSVEVVIDTTDGGDPIYPSAPYPNITASQTKSIKATIGHPAVVDSAFDSNNNARGPLPRILLGKYGRFRTVTTGIQSGDQWASNPTLYVEEYISPNVGW